MGRFSWGNLAEGGGGAWPLFPTCSYAYVDLTIGNTTSKVLIRKLILFIDITSCTESTKTEIWPRGDNKALTRARNAYLVRTSVLIISMHFHIA